MNSRLKSLELQGYKTFATRTIFEFPGPVTAIVGPNGSGKSNIADALRWVLGEQSYSLMRGKRTEDMIFSGSEQRSRAGMATATIVFDNSDHWLALDYLEVAVARRAYRDGSNEYLINGQRVRLKDVSELLSESGLAERTYTIIGQGLVDAALALKAEERRRLFEEAAGISLFRTRREESIRRLEITQRNLERAEDILTELKPRLVSLERQARRAEDFERVRDELREMLREWYGYHWHQMQSDVADAMEIMHSSEKNLNASKLQQTTLDNELNQIRDRIQTLRTDLSDWLTQSSKLHIKREEKNRHLAVAEERFRAYEDKDKYTQSQIDQVEEEVMLQQEILERTSVDEEQLNFELEEASLQKEMVTSSYQDWQKELDGVQSKRNSIRENSIQVTARIAFIHTRTEEGENRIKRMLVELEELDSDINTTGKNLSTFESEIHQLENTIRTIDKNKLFVGNKLEDIRNEIANSDTEISGFEQTKRNLETDIASTLAEIEVISQAELTLVGYSEGVKLLIQASKQSQLSGAIGTLGKFINVLDGYNIAISAALGEFVDAILVEGDQGVEDALTILENHSVRGVILPVNRLSLINFHNIDGLGDPSIKHAKDLVLVKDDYRKVLDLLLANTIVVSDRGIARKLIVELEKERRDLVDFDLRIVTIQGEIFHTRGDVTAGLSSNSGILIRSGRMNELNQELSQLRKMFENINRKLGHSIVQKEALKEKGSDLEDEYRSIQLKQIELIRKLEAKENELDQNLKQVDWTRGRREKLSSEIDLQNQHLDKLKLELIDLESSLEELKEKERSLTEELNQHLNSDIQSDLPHWTTRVAVLDRALREAQSRKEERKQQLKESHNRLSKYQTESEDLKSSQNDLMNEIESIRNAGIDIGAEIERMQGEIEPAETKLNQAEKLQADLQQKEGKARQALTQSEHYYTQARITLAKRQESLEGLRRRIEDDFGLVAFEYAEEISGPNPLPLQGMVEELPVISETSQGLDESIKRQRAQLRRMGPINPEARKEFIEVTERHEFLVSQMNDLHKAAGDMRQVIAELDVMMERQFRLTFDAVADEFHHIFSRLFGGGSARLVLTDPNDLTETGIDIEARLPGRREQGLSLLSGGERSLSAVALVFAILRISPTPFCVLDEVDAMLDEANVGRFGELLKELSQNTQFLLITHNRATVQLADIIYGVTMGRDSTSQSISLKLDEIEKVV